MYLVFDTETTGLPKNFDAPYTDTDNWPRLVQLAWQLHDEKGELVEVKNYIIKPEGFSIPFNAEKIHGISTERAKRQGLPLEEVLGYFNEALEKASHNVGHNIGFDVNIMGCEYHRKGMDTPLHDKLIADTKHDKTANYCAIPGGRGGKFKWPTLTELHTKLFKEGFDEAHNASADVEATARCFLELVRINVFDHTDLQVSKESIHAFREHNLEPFELIGLNIEPYTPDDVEFKDAEDDNLKVVSTADDIDLEDVSFCHLHNHTQFSVLQSTTRIDNLIKKAADFRMPAVAMTDLGNMMGAFHFVNKVLKHNKAEEGKQKEAEEKGENYRPKTLKPIVGCEFNICENHTDKTRKDNGFQVPLLAKNRKGYHNLAKLSSQAFIEGMYYVPRIDKEILVQHKEDVIALTGGILGEIPHLILNVGEEQAEEAFLWWKEQFGEDFYAELTDHGLEEEKHVNRVLISFCQKHGVKYIAANNSFYLEQKDAQSHDILLCVKEGEKKSTPIGRGRGYRYGFPNDQFYFKSQAEMKEIFSDFPEAISNIKEIVDKIEPFDLARDVLLPKYDIPEEFIDPEDEKDGGKRGENAYLRHLTYEGAKKRYDEITDEIRERLDFELQTIANTGYPGYFLIVQDFTNEARKMGVAVGPGRGSAAGSAVAYCTGITNVDPIAYDLLFERFLNPDRVSLPDIDIDFDDDGRGKVIDYVINKYGSSQVAQIITYGTMAAKSSIRDTGRVLDLPLPDTDRLAKLVPDMKLNKLFAMDERKMKEKLSGEQIQMAKELIETSKRADLEGETVSQAVVLEGSLRNTGIHACGVIITPSDIREHVPVALTKDGDMWCTQFDNAVVENAGLLKMDFLGLKTLTLIKDAIAIVKDRHGIEINPDEIPLDDEKTYELFQKGETVGVFQYESPGMQKYLKDLKPTVFGDLIAMNALYRPGPLEYIPSFVKRKHGLEEIAYDLEGMEEYLEETYGITVYQEQVMLLSQKLAGFTKGEADMLRKAMGKKIFSLLEKMKPKFIEGGKERGHDPKILEKVWKDWEAFAAYAFNKSHSTCYAWVAFQTAYLKAHYPAEYMASVLSNNMNDIKTVTFFMEECRRMGIPVLGPCVNESNYKFTVNQKGEIRFGLGAIKGVGGNAVESIVKERKENGLYNSIFDLTSRIDLRSANKKTLEGLALAGGFDNFKNVHRAMYFHQNGNGNLLELAIKYGNSIQNGNESNQASLFGDDSGIDIPEPTPAPCLEWGSLEKLSKEKEVVGIFITGHPLDDFKLEIEHFCTNSLADLEHLPKLAGKEIILPGIVTVVEHRVTRNGKPFGTIELEDYSGNHKFFLFGEDYLKLRHFMIEGHFLVLKGKVQARKWAKDPSELEFKIHSIELLADAREKWGKLLDMEFSINDLNGDLIEKLDELFNRYEGSCAVKMRVYDNVENIYVNMPSRDRKVELSNDFIQELTEFEEIKFKLN